MRRQRRPYKHPIVDPMDDVLNLPGANPLKIITASSDACAATALIQYRRLLGFGAFTTVDSVFQAPLDTIPADSRELFLARKKVIEWFQEHGKRWRCILYRYEIVKASAKRERDWGHLVFVDMSLSRFLLVMVYPSVCDCGECNDISKHDYAAMTKYQAHRFMSLLKCVYHDIEIEPWVRATYTTQELNYTLDPTFASPYEPPEVSDTEDTGSEPRPPIICVKSENFVPCLLLSELERIDNLRAQESLGQSIPPHVRAQVLGSKDTRPNFGSAWNQRNPRKCSYCGTLKEKNLMLCAKYKIYYYCGRECQKLAWPSHKRFCRKG